MTNYPTAPRLSNPLNKPFVAHQQAFATFLRQQRFYNESVVLADTADQPLLDDLSPRIGKLYQSLVYNNVSSFINQCFPVCQTMVDSTLWQTLIQLFIASNHLKSPYFVEINQQFCAFLAETVFDTFDILPFLAELAHYEWIELLVEMLPDEPFVGCCQHYILIQRCKYCIMIGQFITSVLIECLTLPRLFYWYIVKKRR